MCAYVMVFYILADFYGQVCLKSLFTSSGLAFVLAHGERVVNQLLSHVLVG